MQPLQAPRQDRTRIVSAVLVGLGVTLLVSMAVVKVAGPATFTSAAAVGSKFQFGVSTPFRTPGRAYQPQSRPSFNPVVGQPIAREPRGVATYMQMPPPQDAGDVPYDAAWGGTPKAHTNDPTPVSADGNSLGKKGAIGAGDSFEEYMRKRAGGGGAAPAPAVQQPFAPSQPVASYAPPPAPAAAAPEGTSKIKNENPDDFATYLAKRQAAAEGREWAPPGGAAPAAAAPPSYAPAQPAYAPAASYAPPQNTGGPPPQDAGDVPYDAAWGGAPKAHTNDPTPVSAEDNSLGKKGAIGAGDSFEEYMRKRAGGR